jgi:hypothetical protein
MLLPEPKMRKCDFKNVTDLLVLHVMVHAIDFLLSKVMFYITILLNLKMLFSLSM